MLFQYAALFSSMTLEENVSLPLVENAGLCAGRPSRGRVALELALVGLAGFEQHYPAEVSGGIRKRAGLARAMALDPEILYFDEPSAGLDPLSSRRLDDLVLELRASLGTTIVLVTHELPSIFELGDLRRLPRHREQDHHRQGIAEGDARVQGYGSEGAALPDARRGRGEGRGREGRAWVGKPIRS